MTTAFQQSAFQWTPDKAFQIDAEAGAVKTGTGGIDPGEGLRRIVKPTGLLHLPKKARADVEARIDDSRAIQAEIAGRLAREFSEETTALEAFKAFQAFQAFQPIDEMSLAEIDAEIGLLLKLKLRREEDEIMLLLLMSAAT